METPAFQIFEKTGSVAITSLEQWFARAPPRGREKQWKDKRSAKELARRWVGAFLPDEVVAALDTQPALRGFAPKRGLAEYVTKLDHFGPGRVHDLLLEGAADGAMTVIGIEGKADEKFGQTVEKALQEVEGVPSDLPARIDRLCKALFGKGPADEPSLLRLYYQLVYAAAACLIEANQRRCQSAVFLTHEFKSTGLNGASLARNQEGLNNFVRAVSRGSTASVPHNGVVGPFRVAGDPARKGFPEISASIDFYIGRATHDLDGATAK